MLQITKLLFESIDIGNAKLCYQLLEKCKTINICTGSLRTRIFTNIIKNDNWVEFIDVIRDFYCISSFIKCILVDYKWVSNNFTKNRQIFIKYLYENHKTEINIDKIYYIFNKIEYSHDLDFYLQLFQEIIDKNALFLEKPKYDKFLTVLKYITINTFTIEDQNNLLMHYIDVYSNSYDYSYDTIKILLKIVKIFPNNNTLLPKIKTFIDDIDNSSESTIYNLKWFEIVFHYHMFINEPFTKYYIDILNESDSLRYLNTKTYYLSFCQYIKHFNIDISEWNMHENYVQEIEKLFIFTNLTNPNTFNEKLFEYYEKINVAQYTIKTWYYNLMYNPTNGKRVREAEINFENCKRIRTK